MQTTTIPKTLKNDTSPALRTLVVVDLGNGLVKALIRSSGAKRFELVSFPSHVAETEQSNSDCLRVYTPTGFQSYLVGDRAAEVPLSHTGRDESGKAANAKLLVIHALRLAFGTDYQCLHCDVIFTSPSNKAYGSEISAQLQNVHPVTIPADAEVIGSEAQSYTINIHRAIPQLEGHYAFESLKLKGESWILDCGNRTLIATKVRENGGIIKRQYFGGVGVRGLAERISARESLATEFKEHSPDNVIDFLLDAKHGKNIEQAIAPDVSACTAETLAFIGDDTAPRHLIGGGAAVPGLPAALNAKPAKNAQWVNIQSLANAADRILEVA